jgi:hypothetical protein
MVGKFQETLEEFQSNIDDAKTVSVEKMLTVLNNRGFGAILIIPCMIELFPTGVIPGVPSLCATLIILFAIQIAFGRRYPWVPDYLGQKRFKVGKIDKGLEKFYPTAKWIDRQSRKRWKFLVSHTTERLSAFLIIALACCIYPLELIPFASSIPTMAILLIAVSFITKDGLLLAMSWVASTIAFGSVAYILKTSIMAE